MEAQEQISGWKVDEPGNFYQDSQALYKLPNNFETKSAVISGKSKTRKSILSKSKQNNSPQNGKKQFVKLGSNKKRIYERFHKKIKNHEVTQSLNSSVQEIYKSLDKKVSYPMMNGTYLKFQCPKNKFVPSCSVDRLDAFFYSLENSSSHGQMVIKTNNSVPCKHQLSKIIENNLVLKRKYSKMLVDEQKENIQMKKIPQKQELLSNMKCWSRFPCKNICNPAKIKSVPLFLSKKTKKCLSSHFELEHKFRQYPDKTTFEVCAVKIS